MAARPSSGGLDASLRRTLAALSWSLALLTALCVPAAAQDREPLTPAAIAAFEQQLTGARATQADIAARVTCFDGQRTSLIQQRDKDQLRLGELIRHKKDLEPVLVAQEAEYRGFEKARDAEQAELSRLNDVLVHLRYRKEIQERALADCKASPWTINALCDLAYGLAHLTGHFVDNERQIAEAQRRFDSVAGEARAAEERYRASRTAHDGYEADAITTGVQIGAAETAIGGWKAALSTLETNTHDSKLLLDEFDGALDEARRVDTADGKARTARAVRGLAVRVDEARRRSGALLDQAKTSLTEQQLRSCF